MKRITLFLAVIVMALGLSCCTTSPKENILKEVNEFFANAETQIKAIDNAEDLFNFIKGFDMDRDLFGQALDEKYQRNEDGLYKGMKAADMEALMNAISERATEYNKIEYAKCGEIMEPYVARVESVINQFGQYTKVDAIPDELIDEYINAAEELEKYGDVVPEELAERYYAADSTVAVIFGIEE